APERVERTVNAVQLVVLGVDFHERHSAIARREQRVEPFRRDGELPEGGVASFIDDPGVPPGFTAAGKPRNFHRRRAVAIAERVRERADVRQAETTQRRGENLESCRHRLEAPYLP